MVFESFNLDTVVSLISQDVVDVGQGQARIPAALSIIENVMHLTVNIDVTTRSTSCVEQRVRAVHLATNLIARAATLLDPRHFVV
ncbi:hypothetical protein [Cutibacterium avidum]|uniref:hypothetical protein n=1 Tax=Cutibacterium avidum TaxID=33010 RepID=UPI0007643ADA|nr:hypothetical protein [Cutibacterium avidum]KXA68033.1 hypothetical protein HMPREF3223_00359 [Cutibacterium avidum]MCO6631948.1 hypothetical protein [Cutibacterium avidum]MCO6664255.1 hypothetical protein [Cutibacterium avidum]MCO6678943.1 hypothetical protein [Cutibacterium avidum]MCT1416707.1 hypothetical protein [Cutibacterium avidum]